MKTQSRLLHSELCSTTKGKRTIYEFIAHARAISEALLSIGDPISHLDLIVANVNGTYDLMPLS